MLADVTIVELAKGRDELPGDRARIVDRMATAGFTPKLRPRGYPTQRAVADRLIDTGMRTGGGQFHPYKAFEEDAIELREAFSKH